MNANVGQSQVVGLYGESFGLLYKPEDISNLKMWKVFLPEEEVPEVRVSNTAVDWTSCYVMVYSFIFFPTLGAGRSFF